MADVKWIKLSVGIFDDPDIILMLDEYGADAFLFWIKLLSLAGKQNNNGLINNKNNQPYSIKEISKLLSFSCKKVEKFLQIFDGIFSFICQNSNGILIKNWEKHQNIGGLEKIRQQNNERVKRYREKSENVTLQVTQCNATDKERRKKKEEEDKEIEKKDIFCNKYFQKTFTLYQEHCKNLKPLLFEKRNRETLNILGEVLEEIDYDFEQFKELCIKANKLEKIVNSPIDFKSMLKNYIGILSGKYETGNVLDLSKIDFS